MSEINQFFKNHKVSVIFAILLSLIAVFPQVFFRFDHRDDGIYQGIELIPDSPWSARVREVQDGYGFGNIYQKDGKDNPYLYQPLGTMVVAYMGSLFHLDINDTFLLSRLVFPFIVFLLIYGFAYLLSRDKLVSLSSASVLLLADSVSSYSGLSALLRGVSPDHFLRLARPVNPVMIYFFLFSFLITFWLFYKNKNWKYGLASGILLGLNFYNYFYSWTYLYAFGAFLVLFALLRKQWQEALRLSYVALIGLVIAIPYFLNMYRASLFSTFDDLGLRSGIIFTHAPLYVGSVVILAVVIFFLFFPKEDRERYTFCLAILLAPFLTMNQQIITGKIMQADHYHWFFHKPMAIILVLIAIFYFLEKHGWVLYKKILGIIIILASIGTGIFVQTYSYYYDTNDGGQVIVEKQKYGPVMKWLSENAEKGAVVLGNYDTSYITTIYTPQNVFTHPGACCTSLSATKSRMVDSVFVLYRLRQVDAKSAQEIFRAERDDISSRIYGIYYRKLHGTYDAIPDEKIEELVSLYKKTLSVPAPIWLKQMLEKYDVGYLVWDKKQDPDWNPGKYVFFKEVASFDNDLIIYRFIR